MVYHSEFTDPSFKFCDLEDEEDRSDSFFSIVSAVSLWTR